MSEVFRLNRTSTKHFQVIANLHCKEISGGVLSIFGEEFLATLYTYISEAPNCGVWVSEDREEFNGFICGCADDKQMFRWVFVRGFFPLFAIGLKSITRSGVLSGAINVVKVLLKSKHDEPTTRAQLLSLAVKSDSRGKGIGRSLVHVFEIELGAWGVDEWLVWTTNWNLAAIKFYESNGFRQALTGKHSTGDMVGLLKLRAKPHG